MAKQFRYSFGNALTESESGELFDKWAIPGPGKPLFEASAANFKKSSPAAVDTRKRDRGPLLIVAGGKDHTVPEVAARRSRCRGGAGGGCVLVPDQELEAVGVVTEVHQQVTGPLRHPLPRRVSVIPAMCTRRPPCPMTNSTYRRRRNAVPAWKKPAARIVSPGRPGMPARTARTAGTRDRCPPPSGSSTRPQPAHAGTAARRSGCGAGGIRCRSRIGRTGAAPPAPVRQPGRRHQPAHRQPPRDQPGQGRGHRPVGPAQPGPGSGSGSCRSTAISSPSTSNPASSDAEEPASSTTQPQEHQTDHPYRHQQAILPGTSRSTPAHQQVSHLRAVLEPTNRGSFRRGQGAPPGMVSMGVGHWMIALVPTCRSRHRRTR
jgi:hypothetical protein